MRYLKLSLVFGVIAVLILPVALHAMSTAEAPGEVYHPQIREVSGPVMVKGMKYAIWEPAEAGMLLLAGDVLKTDKEGYAVVEFASGTVEIYEATVMVIPSLGVKNRIKDIREVVVEEGNALFDINPLGVERGFEFRTKNIQGGVKGTIFSVSYLEGKSSVNVFRGVVKVSDLEGSDDTRVNLAAGSAVRVEQRTDFSKVQAFDTESGLDEFIIKARGRKDKKDKKDKNDKKDKKDKKPKKDKKDKKLKKVKEDK